jgi:hypothetical protein
MAVTRRLVCSQQLHRTCTGRQRRNEREDEAILNTKGHYSLERVFWGWFSNWAANAHKGARPEIHETTVRRDRPSTAYWRRTNENGTRRAGALTTCKQYEGTGPRRRTDGNGAGFRTRPCAGGRGRRSRGTSDTIRSKRYERQTIRQTIRYDKRNGTTNKRTKRTKRKRTRRRQVHPPTASDDPGSRSCGDLHPRNESRLHGEDDLGAAPG